MTLFLHKVWRHYAILLVAIGLNATILLPELRITKFDQNDNVLHWMLIQDMAEAKNPMDFWSPEIGLGQPIARLYQPGAHFIVLTAWRAMFKAVPLMDVFIWIRFLSVALLPLSFFWCARLLGMGSAAASGAAAVSWLISGDSWGLDFGSYAWAGHGLFPQAVSSHFLLLAIGLGWHAIRVSKSRWFWILPTLALILCGWTNLLYGYVGAVTLILITVIPGADTFRRFRNLLLIGLCSAAAAAPKLIAWAQDAGTMVPTGTGTTGREWMTHGIGAQAVLKQLVTGEMLDHGRLPVLTLLACGGFLLIVTRKVAGDLAVFLVAGFLLWLQLLFGSTFWGPVIKLFGIGSAFQVHRLVGPVELFLVLIGGCALAWGFEYLYRDRKLPLIATALLCVLILEPAIQDRVTRMGKNSDAGEVNMYANNFFAKDVQDAMDVARKRGGRAYAGNYLRGTPPGWGNTTVIGLVPIYAALTANRVPNIGFMYISLLKGNDEAYLFDDQSEKSYIDCNVRTVIANASWAAPEFLKQIRQTENFNIYSAPGKGYIEDSIYEFDAPGQYAAKVQVAQGRDLMVRVSYHGGWKAKVDNADAPVLMAANGLIKIPVPAGVHEVSLKYR